MSCSKVVILSVGVLAAGALVVTRPAIVQQAEQAGVGAVQWTAHALSGVTAPARPAPAQPATTQPIVVTTAPPPSSSPTACIDGCQPQGAPCAPTCATASPTLPVLSNSVDCAWAENTLTWDATLDAQEATALTSGTDSRYPATDAPYYWNWWERWTQLGSWVRTACNTQQALLPVEVSNAVPWMAQAIALHRADAQKTPANASWDDMWVSAYQRLIAMVGGG